MAYPRLHVRLRHNGRTALDVPPDRDGLARAQALLGPRIAARLIPVTGEESGVRVTGVPRRARSWRRPPRAASSCSSAAARSATAGCSTRSRWATAS